MKSFIFASLLSTVALTAQAASFDCAKAQTVAERLICSDATLSDLDAKLGADYKQALAQADDVGALKARQRAWIANVRNNCSDTACMTLAYEARRVELASLGAIPVTPSVNQNTVPDPVPALAPAQSVRAGATAPEPYDAAAKPSDAPPSFVSDPAPKQRPATAPTTGGIEQPAALPADPGFGVTDVFRGLFGLGMLALIIGLFKPDLARILIRTPTRGKIFACSLVFLVPMAVGAEWSTSKERKAYEASLRVERERQRDEERRHKQALADAAAVKAAAAAPVKTIYTNATEVADSACVMQSILVNMYMNNRLAGKGRNSLTQDIDDELLKYPAKVRPSIRDLWLRGFAVLDRHENTWMAQSQADREVLALQLGADCRKGMQRVGIH